MQTLHSIKTASLPDILYASTWHKRRKPDKPNEEDPSYPWLAFTKCAPEKPDDYWIATNAEHDGTWTGYTDEENIWCTTCFPKGKP